MKYDHLINEPISNARPKTYADYAAAGRRRRAYARAMLMERLKKEKKERDAKRDPAVSKFYKQAGSFVGFRIQSDRRV